MLVRVYADPRLKERLEHSWLKKEIEVFLNHLAGIGYRFCFVRQAANQLLNFGEWVAKQGKVRLAELPTWVAPFLKQSKRKDEHLVHGRSIVSRFARYLFREQATETSGRLFVTDVVDNYVRYVKEQQGLRPGTVYNVRKHCERFLVSLGEDGLFALTAVAPEAILAFIVAEGKRYTRTTMASLCGDLRGLLRYLHRHGQVAVDHSHVVFSPRVFRQEACPRFLTRAEVDAVLGVVDRQTVLGRRDYAMILLLATYGLRGGEVVRLRLDDLDWRTCIMHVCRRKAGNDSTYPLSTPVGEAILAYLRDGRPASPHREIFLSSMPPFFPFPDCAALTAKVRGCMVKAGIKVDRPGTHTLRYSCAQRLLEQGMPLKTIGDYLGHRDPESTQRYTKMGLDRLRDVALGNGEDLL